MRGEEGEGGGGRECDECCGLWHGGQPCPPENSLQDGSDPREANQVHVPGPTVHAKQPVGQEEEGGCKKHDPPAHTLQGGKGIREEWEGVWQRVKLLCVLQ